MLHTKGMIFTCTMIAKFVSTKYVPHIYIRYTINWNNASSNAFQIKAKEFPKGLNSGKYAYFLSANSINLKQVPVLTGISRARNSRWGMLPNMNEAGTY